MSRTPLSQVFAVQQDLADAIDLVEAVIKPPLKQLALYFDAKNPRKLNYALFYLIAMRAAADQIEQDELHLVIEAAYAQQSAATEAASAN